MTNDPEVLRYAAFTTDPAGGNPAGVVLDAAGLHDAAMQDIAGAVGYSETAFLTPTGEADRYTVRYFSPLAEVPFCGHATIAAAVALAERPGPGPGELTFLTPVGEVPVVVRPGADGPLATLSSVEPHQEPVAAADLAEALAALDWSSDSLDPTLPPVIAFAGARHLVLAAASRARLAALDYDVDRLTSLMLRLDLTTLHLVWRESPTVFHVRDPFPVGGVEEDPATGAAAAALGGYLRDIGQVEPAAVLTLHQGHDLGRPSLLTVELRAGDPRVHVTGTAVRIPDGTA